MRDAGRLPPGQSATIKWPVLHLGDVPHFDPLRWYFLIAGQVENPVRLSWKEFTSLPTKEVIADMHCVTKWSRFDVRWEGVPFTEVYKIAGAKPEAKYVMVLAEQGFTSNVPLEDLLRPTTLFALRHNGEELPSDHGYPLRLVVPHLYSWKSVKWVRGLEFMVQDAPGLWEQNGYHMYGDPFKEQRFSR
jgi:DMSO/TMAO reductase YedYZ molybdopterin-dependent catalytic subunit